MTATVRARDCTSTLFDLLTEAHASRQKRWQAAVDEVLRQVERAIEMLRKRP